MTLLSPKFDQKASSPSVRIHSAIADGGNFIDRRGSAAISLWYYVRALDSKGSGCATFALEDACKLLGKGKSTVKRYLTNGLRLGLFRSYSTSDDHVRVFYSSLHEVAIRCGLESFGAVAELEIDQLKNLKFWAIQLEAQNLQNQSRFQARNAGGMKRKVAKPENVLPSPSLDSQPSQEGSKPGVRTRLHVSDRYCFMHHSFVEFGASQKTVSSRAGRHKSTVQRRLDNQYRRERGIPSLLKRQVAIEVEPEELIRLTGSDSAEEFNFHKSQSLDFEVHRLFLSGGRVFKPVSNIYENAFHIQSMKASKAIYREKVTRILSGN